MNAADRKQRGAWYTPDALVATVVGAVVTSPFVAARRSPVRIVDPACGDGRFLRAAAEHVIAAGGRAHVVGADIDADAVVASGRLVESLPPEVTSEILHVDALTFDWAAMAPFDLVVGNPPFLSQLAAATTRGGSSRRGGGPYADAAVEFLALAAEIVDPSGGRVAFVLPQSLLAARDAAPVRDRYDASAELLWSWWTGEREFDAQVLTCALAFEFGAGGRASAPAWSRVITSRRGIPDLPAQVGEQGAGRLADRARLNANFRDEYYGMVGAVGDHEAGPPLITSGLIDPGRSLWGARPVTFAKQRFERPRIDLAALDARMRRWAADRLVPKVLIANQTKIIEAVADPDGTLLPGVPVVAAYPDGIGDDHARVAWEIAAVLTSPVASAWAWHRNAGTGLSADAIRLGPVVLSDLPWPAGRLDRAVTRLQGGDVRGCASEVHGAFGIDETDGAGLMSWWLRTLERVESRRSRDAP